MKQWEIDREYLLTKFRSLLEDVDRLSEEYWFFAEQTSSQKVESQCVRISDALNDVYELLSKISVLLQNFLEIKV